VAEEVKLTASGLRTPVHDITAEEPTPLKSTQLKSTLLKKIQHNSSTV